MKILFASMPFDGHFNPLTGIAKHLLDRGHDVRWYAAPRYLSKLEELGIPAFPFVRAEDVNGDNVAELFPERAALSGPKLIEFDLTQVFVANVGAHYDDVSDIHAQFPFEALVCDGGFYAGKLVREKLGARVYPVGVAPLMCSSGDAPPPFFGLRPAKTIFGKLVHRVVRAMVEMPMKSGVRMYDEVLTSRGLAPIECGWLDVPVECATTYFQSGVPGFAFERRDLPATVRFVGPVLPRRASRARPFAHEDRVRSCSSLVVVSQGTVDNRDPEKLIVPALEALRSSGRLVIATTGGRHTQALRARFPDENVIVEDYVDFDVLLEHADLFICNGGYGSVLTALMKGVPVLAAGVREGKNDVNAHVAWFGVGVDLKTERPTAKKIARASARILADPRYRNAAQRLRAELESYQPLELMTQHIEG